VDQLLNHGLELARQVAREGDRALLGNERARLRGLEIEPDADPPLPFGLCGSRGGLRGLGRRPVLLARRGERLSQEA